MAVSQFGRSGSKELRPEPEADSTFQASSLSNTLLLARPQCERYHNSTTIWELDLQIHEPDEAFHIQARTIISLLLRYFLSIVFSGPGMGRCSHFPLGADPLPLRANL